MDSLFQFPDDEAKWICQHELRGWSGVGLARVVMVIENEDHEIPVVTWLQGYRQVLLDQLIRSTLDLLTSVEFYLCERYGESVASGQW